MRITRIVARVLFVIVMICVMVAGILHVVLFGAGATQAGWLYIPTNSNMRAHAEKLANHFANRLAEPPMPILVSELGTDSSYKRIGESLSYPYLTTADLPKRYEVLWTSTDGWLSDTPKQHRDNYDHLLNYMAVKYAEGNWENNSAFTVLWPTADRPDSAIFAGRWTYTKSGTSFRGAITPGFYEHYAPRWFLEYKVGNLNRYLDNYMWRPAEFRIAFRDSTVSPFVLRAGQSVDLTEKIDPSDDSEGAEFKAEYFRWLTSEMNVEPGWQDEVEWMDSPIASFDASIEVSSPFKMDQVILDLSVIAGRWAIGLILAGIAFGILGWGSIKR